MQPDVVADGYEHDVEDGSFTTKPYLNGMNATTDNHDPYRPAAYSSNGLHTVGLLHNLSQKQKNCAYGYKVENGKVNTTIEFFITYAGEKSLKAFFYSAAENSLILTNFKLIIIRRNSI